MSSPSIALAKSTKFKVGDYITASDKVFLKIIAVVDSGMGAMYYLYNPRPDLKGDNYRWESQYELDEQKLVVGVPDYEGANKLQAGDILNLGSPEAVNYSTVLARVGNAVLISQTPDKKKADMLLKLDDAMKEMSSEFGEMASSLLDDEQRAQVKKMKSSIHASKTAGEWWDVERIALMNWQILGEE